MRSFILAAGLAASGVVCATTGGVYLYMPGVTYANLCELQSVIWDGAYSELVADCPSLPLQEPASPSRYRSGNVVVTLTGAVTFSLTGCVFEHVEVTGNEHLIEVDCRMAKGAN